MVFITYEYIKKPITLNGIRDIFLVAFRGERSNFWLLGPTGDREYGATDSMFCSFSIGDEY